MTKLPSFPKMASHKTTTCSVAYTIVNVNYKNSLQLSTNKHVNTIDVGHHMEEVIQDRTNNFTWTILVHLPFQKKKKRQKLGAFCKQK